MRIRSDGEQTRAKILAAACEVFGEKGYPKATFAEMGRRGDFNGALISFHFGSKDDLYRTVWRTLLQRVRERWPVDGGLPVDTPAEQQLEAHVRASLHRSCDPDLASLHRIHMQERVNPTGLLEKEVSDHRRENQQHMRGLLRQLLGDSATEADIDLCEMSIINQFSVLRQPKHRHGKAGPKKSGHPHFPRFTEADIKRLTEHITRFCLAGVAAVHQAIEERKETT